MQTTTTTTTTITKLNLNCSTTNDESIENYRLYSIWNRLENRTEKLWHQMNRGWKSIDEQFLLLIIIMLFMIIIIIFLIGYICKISRKNSRKQLKKISKNLNEKCYLLLSTNDNDDDDDNDYGHVHL
ncbi:hypothetical protein DERF_013806 [Dermatophagoides farinae]|uniref:Uncharacterized protein n=1 Tax=Dermatophagoides farinae TaxID=6954 RepID=A0A922KVX6_DERFA|nr:hypothetical protein DERF_013806 [Dermatophagoides farinae]